MAGLVGLALGLGLRLGEGWGGHRAMAHRAALPRGVLGDAVHLLDGASLLVQRAVLHEAAQVGLHRAVELPRVELLEELVHAAVLVHADAATDLLAHTMLQLSTESAVCSVRRLEKLSKRRMSCSPMPRAMHDTDVTCSL